MSAAGAAWRIRQAAPEDRAALLGLIRELAEYESLTHLVTATEDSIAATLFGPDANAEALLAESDGCGVGFALYFHNVSTFLGRRGLYLEDLYVQPAWRGRGIGKALLRVCARVAVERGCGRFEWMALDWNVPAIGFYESLGAVQHPEWRLFRMTGDALARFGAAE
jgi:GNAT superfamily N-acetyltransferase